MAIIYHITGREEWNAAVEQGSYIAPSLVSEGFIHCSEESQVQGVLRRYFAGRDHLVKLVIDTTRLHSKLLYEHSPSVNESFPHIYGPLNLDAVTEVETIG